MSSYLIFTSWSYKIIIYLKLFEFYVEINNLT